MITFEFMSASEIAKRFRSSYEKKERETGVPFFDTDDLDNSFHRQPSERGKYIVALDEGKPVAIRKFYHWSEREREYKQFFLKNGDDRFKGTLYLTAYIGTNPKYKRKGLASHLNDMMMEILSPGDLVKTSSHEEEGVKFFQAWYSKNRTKYNFVFGKNFYDLMEGYDPLKKNYWAYEI